MHFTGCCSPQSQPVRHNHSNQSSKHNRVPIATKTTKREIMDPLFNLAWQGGHMSSGSLVTKCVHNVTQHQQAHTARAVEQSAKYCAKCNSKHTTHKLCPNHSAHKMCSNHTTPRLHSNTQHTCCTETPSTLAAL